MYNNEVPVDFPIFQGIISLKDYINYYGLKKNIDLKVTGKSGFESTVDAILIDYHKDSEQIVYKAKISNTIYVTSLKYCFAIADVVLYSDVCTHCRFIKQTPMFKKETDVDY